MKRSVLSVIAGGLTHFLLGFLIYGLLLMDFMVENTSQFEGLMREDISGIPGYVISSVLFAILITYILNRTVNHGAVSGLLTAAVVSFFIAASLNVNFYFGTNLYTSAYLVTDVLAYTVMGGLTGMVVGMILRKNTIVV
jgi:glucose-6-phosphate-specific signal transduction histidine kinase